MNKPYIPIGQRRIYAIDGEAAHPCSTIVVNKKVRRKEMDKLCVPTGRVRLYTVDGEAAHTYSTIVFDKEQGRHVREHRQLPGWKNETPFKKNLVLYDWATIVANLLATANNSYRITTMYIEFENVASPGDPVSIPDFDRTPESGAAYFEDLSLSSGRDYLRLPVLASAVSSSDDTNFPRGNIVTYFAQTAGIEGQHGKPFSASDNSTVCGGALVATPSDDPTQDLVLCRFYLDEAAQQIKSETAQIGLEWELTLN